MRVAQGQLALAASSHVGKQDLRVHGDDVRGELACFHDDCRIEDVLVRLHAPPESGYQNIGGGGCEPAGGGLWRGAQRRGLPRQERSKRDGLCDTGWTKAFREEAWGDLNTHITR